MEAGSRRLEPEVGRRRRGTISRSNYSTCLDIQYFGAKPLMSGRLTAVQQIGTPALSVNAPLQEALDDQEQKARQVHESERSMNSLKPLVILAPPGPDIDDRED